LSSFLGISSYSRAAVINVRRQHCLGAMHHEESRESRGSTRCGA
jgi:hypothetical protein